MSLMRRRKLITVGEAAEILGLAKSTVHNKKAGTENLTRVYQGRIVKLYEYEVLKHLDQLVEKAKQR